MNGTGSTRPLSSDDRRTLRRVLSRHPIRLAVVFGSQVRGDAHPTSDIDLAVEFDDSVEGAKTDARLRLIADVSSALGRNAVDVVDIATIRPAVGKSALEHGIVLLGSSERAEHYRDAFDRIENDSDRTRSERFDAVLDRIEELV